MNSQRLVELRDLYRDGLLKDTIPWWQSRMIDTPCGGYLTYRDADGSLVGTDKPVWVLGRVIWMWSRLYNTVEPRPEWLKVARHGVDFMLQYAFDTDGRMFYSLTRDGRPLRKRRYLFSETFAAIALAEYGTASGDRSMIERARQVFQLTLRYHRTPGLCEPKTNPAVRPLKGLAMPMILIATAQVMREHDPDPLYDEVIREQIAEIQCDFFRPDRLCVLENVLADGSFLDEPVGRTLNPGHAIEAGWFILEEARRRADAGLIELGCAIIDCSLQRGWDPEYGGILYFLDCDGKPPEPYEHELKLWWPHNETLYALLLAHHLTGQAKWADWYEKVHQWSFDHFPDRTNGEWFGYLRRDGTVSNPIKGNMWKGPFHLPRMQLNAWKLLEQMIVAAQ